MQTPNTSIITAKTLLDEVFLKPSSKIIENRFSQEAASEQAKCSVHCSGLCKSPGGCMGFV